MLNIIETEWAWTYPLTTRAVTARIILHHAAATSASVEAIHRCHLANGWNGIGYHYYVRKDGSIYRGRPETAIGIHAGAANYNSIAICFEGNFETDEMNNVQTEAGAMLVADIKSRYGDLNVIRHKDVNSTACPGKNFRFDDIKEGFMTYETFKEYMTKFEAERAEKGADGYALEACKKAVASGIFADGDGDGSLDNPQAPLKRQEFAAILNRLGMLD